MRPLTKALLGLVAVIGIVQALAVMALTWPLAGVRAWLLVYWQPAHWSCSAWRRLSASRS
ncbi:hypothetical protein [Lacticaseibacillus camelliae]|uniref:hypothetical protein n=1 Tax=Lacticaseibacillus camelliae TaxID=381742 RepID=UPI0006D203EA|nr:hypothetical protein [Lacticaseibacillus camelliae]